MDSILKAISKKFKVKGYRDIEGIADEGIDFGRYNYKLNR